jgi:glutamate dehydrogenase (NADP+)
MIFVTPRFAADSILEAAAAGLELIVAITEGIPAHDELRVYNTLRRDYPGTRLIGPNCPGLLSPGKANVGVIAASVFSEGAVGVVSRSGTLTYQIGKEIAQAGLGCSTIVGIGGDPVPGSSFVEIIELFAGDPETELIVRAGDIGVGLREIGYLFGQYKRITNEFSGVLTGKGVEWGGSYVRPEATGYGLVYFAEEMAAPAGETLADKRCLVSGAGNVAQFTAKKLIEVGAKVLTMSDSDGFIHDPEGIDAEKLAWVFQLKNERRGRISEYPERFPGATYVPAAASGATLWSVPADCAFPCATQNELSEADAARLLANGVTLVAEGANMPTSPRGVARFLEAGVLYGPSKAANAGGVAVSGLEMSQDADHLSWSPEEVDRRLRLVMGTIHANVRQVAAEYGHPGNYVVGANIAGFVKVADAMMAEGVA